MFQTVRRTLLSLMMQNYQSGINICSPDSSLEDSNLNHILIFDLPSENSGRAYLARLLSAIGFLQQEECYIDTKSSDYICMADEEQPQLPRLVLADFRVRDMSKRVRNLMRKFTDYTVPFDHLKLDAVYIAMKVKECNLKSVLTGLMHAGFKGLNVTMPHKTSCAELCDSLDPLAQKLGSVNTIKFSDGNMEGFNTDAVAIKRLVKKFSPKSSILILGDGSISKMTHKILTIEGFTDIIRVRRKKDNQHNFLEWNDKNIKRAVMESDIIFNTTPIKHIIAALVENIVPGKCYVDFNYSSILPTKIRNIGCKTVDGRYFLVAQALESFGILTGQKPPTNELGRFMQAVFNNF